MRHEAGQPSELRLEKARGHDLHRLGAHAQVGHPGQPDLHLRVPGRRPGGLAKRGGRSPHRFNLLLHRHQRALRELARDLLHAGRGHGRGARCRELR